MKSFCLEFGRQGPRWPESARSDRGQGGRIQAGKTAISLWIKGLEQTVCEVGKIAPGRTLHCLLNMDLGHPGGSGFGRWSLKLNHITIERVAGGEVKMWLDRSEMWPWLRECRPNVSLAHHAFLHLFLFPDLKFYEMSKAGPGHSSCNQVLVFRERLEWEDGLLTCEPGNLLEPFIQN